MSSTENIGKIITTIGIFVIVGYSVTSILNFYGISADVYGIYIVFYIFLIVTCMSFNCYYSDEI